MANYKEYDPDANSIRAYLQEIGKHPLLTPEQELELGRIVKMGTPRERKRAIDKLVTSNLRLGVSIAKKHLNNGVSLQDLIQEGTLGLFLAAEKFDYTLGYRFSTYAYWWVRQAMTRAIGMRSRTIRLPVGRMETLTKIKRLSRELTQTLGRSPSRKDVADAYGMPLDEMNTRMDEARQCTSLDLRIGTDETISIGDMIPSDLPSGEDYVWERETREKIRASMAYLTDQERIALVFRYGLEGQEPLSCDEVCLILGVRLERLRQIRRGAMIKMKRKSCMNQLEGLLCN